MRHPSGVRTRLTTIGFRYETLKRTVVPTGYSPLASRLASRPLNWYDRIIRSWTASGLCSSSSFASTFTAPPFSSRSRPGAGSVNASEATTSFEYIACTKDRITASGESLCARTARVRNTTPPTSCNANAFVFIHVDRCTTSAKGNARCCAHGFTLRQTDLDASPAGVAAGCNVEVRRLDAGAATMTRLSGPPHLSRRDTSRWPSWDLEFDAIPIVGENN